TAAAPARSRPRLLFLGRRTGVCGPTTKAERSSFGAGFFAAGPTDGLGATGFGAADFGAADAADLAVSPLGRIARYSARFFGSVSVALAWANSLIRRTHWSACGPFWHSLTRFTCC